MKIKLNYFFIALFLLSCIKETNHCYDFSKNWNNKPEELIFIKCYKDKNGKYGEHLSKYKVSGKYAKKVEAYLIAHFKMQKLRFACCGWESGYNAQYKDKKGYTHIIQMGIEETLEKDWNKIPYFYVTDTKYLIEP